MQRVSQSSPIWKLPWPASYFVSVDLLHPALRIVIVFGERFQESH
jgi:hypothetical protein